MAFSEFDAHFALIERKMPAWAQPSRCRRSVDPRASRGPWRFLGIACIGLVLSAALLLQALHAWTG